MKFNRVHIGLFLVGLFHLSAVVGVSLGHQDWFISKTPINLLLTLLVLLICSPIVQFKQYVFLLFSFLVGMLVEIIGVQQGWLFGEYSYGSSLGPKVYGVPWLIGVNWAVLSWVTFQIAARFKQGSIVSATIAAALMVFLDFFMERPAPEFDFWTFENGLAPYRNYLSWFLIAALIQLVGTWLKPKKELVLSSGIYVIQLLFFVYFYVYFIL